MSIATEEQRLINAKAAIKTAIEAKGVTVGAIKLDAYAAKIDLITGGAEPDWVKPADWIDISTVADNTIKLLVADISEIIAFSVTCVGGYTVDWGDGVTDNWASGAVATHSYTTGGTPCSRGYNTFAITISSQSANQITAFGIGALALQRQYDMPILWAVFGTTGLTTCNRMFCNTGGYIMRASYLEKVTFPSSLSNCISFNEAFASAISLMSVDMPTTYSSSVISFYSTFSNCSNLRSLNFNAASLNISTMANCFNVCKLLKAITLPTTINGCSSFNTTFSNCSNLTSITLPTINTRCDASSIFNTCTKITNITFNSSWEDKIIALQNAFLSCYSLQNLILPSTVYLTFATAYAGTFNSCFSLREITFPTNNSSQVLENINSILASCFNLETINNFPSFTGAAYMSTPFSACKMLKDFSNLNDIGNTITSFDHATTFSTLTSITTFSCRNKITGRFVFAGGATSGLSISELASLSSLTLDNAASTFAGASPQIDISYTSMDVAALAALAASLPTLSGKTIRIRGCSGASDTSYDAAFAAKGFSINRLT